MRTVIRNNPIRNRQKKRTRTSDTETEHEQKKEVRSEDTDRKEGATRNGKRGLFRTTTGPKEILLQASYVRRAGRQSTTHGCPTVAK